MVSRLRSKVRAVLESVQNLENLQFEGLKSKLEMRFGSSQFLQNYYSRIERRNLGKSNYCLFEFRYRETSITHIQNGLTYPDLIRDKVACAQFVSALSNDFVKRAFQMEGITSD